MCSNDKNNWFTLFFFTYFFLYQNNKNEIFKNKTCINAHFLSITNSYYILSHFLFHPLTFARLFLDWIVRLPFQWMERRKYHHHMDLLPSQYLEMISCQPILQAIPFQQVMDLHVMLPLILRTVWNDINWFIFFIIHVDVNVWVQEEKMVEKPFLYKFGGVFHAWGSQLYFKLQCFCVTDSNKFVSCGF